MVKLNDIARIELGSEEYTTSATNNGQPVIMMVIYRNTDANAINVVDQAKKRLEELAKHFPEGVSYHMGYDPTEYIRTSMREIVMTLVLTLVLVVAITYLFLQNWRATLIPTLAIPVSIFATFVCLFFMGFSLNLLTMFALILVIGSLVDDAIVVVENVIRIMQEENLPAKEATEKSMKQITGAIIATTLVIIAIYAPIGFYGGMVGTIYVQFSVTMCIALIFSTINALTLSPALCAMILKPAKPLKIFKPFDAFLGWNKSIYLFFTRFLVRSSLITIIVFLVVCAVCYFFYSKTLTSFLPDEDKGALFCMVELDPGATLSRTSEVMQKIQETVQPLPGVKEVIAISGFSMMGGQGENLGLAVIGLKDWDERKTEETSLAALTAKIQELTYSIPGASIRVN